MLTYYWNAKTSGDDTYPYHVFNVVVHAMTSGLVYLMVKRLLRMASVANREILAAFAAGVFLLHPVQTEAVAYLAGRSECFSVMFAFAALAIFLAGIGSTTPDMAMSRDAAPTSACSTVGVSWGRVAAVLALFGLGLASKEHIIVLPALLLITDFWWNPGFSLAGIRANWKLYGAMALGAVGGLAMFWSVIQETTSAGFALKD